MRTLRPIAAFAILAVLLAAASSDAAFAKHRRHSVRPSATSIPVDASGTPIIMKGYQSNPRRRGSSVLVGTPSAGLPDLPAPQLLPAPSPPQIAPVPPTFSDRVVGCIHSYPLNAGVGNNPTEQGAYIRQCAN